MFWNRRRSPLGEDLARGWRDVPAGDEDNRPRVLFESADGAEAHAVCDLLDRHGYRTMWCPGPGGRSARECALSEAGRCPLVDEADAVVSALDVSNARCQEVLRRLDDVAADTPVVVVAPRASADRWSAELSRCRVVAGPLRSGVLIRSLSPTHVAGTVAP